MVIHYCFPGGRAKALTMSYDDGRSQDLRLLSIMNKYGIKGTFNLNYGFLPLPGHIPPEQVEEVYRGHEVATHSLHHPTIARCPLSRTAEEILEDRKGLESLVKYVVRGHAYPNGSYDSEIESLLSNLGIAYARVADSVPDFELPRNPMEWHATCHHSDPKLMEYGRFLAEKALPLYLKLMYVWGHSYEFDDENNWNVIEEFCAYMGGRDDIWYATNIEIIDYMQLVKNLRFTAAGDGVFNPGAATAWIAVDGRVVEVPGGRFTSLG